MTRLVVPELLDHLPADSTAAQRSRRDLRWLNRCMGNPWWWKRTLARTLRPGDRVLEIGAGDAGLHRLAPSGVDWHALDLAPTPASWPDPARWHRGDLRSFTGWADFNVLVGNLVFHHFNEEELAALGAALPPHFRLFLACEPRRSRRAALGLRLLTPILRLNEVTRHDAPASIAAGFRGDELVEALGWRSSTWKCRVRETWLGAYRLSAHKA